jgi:hypothetical protein
VTVTENVWRTPAISEEGKPATTNDRAAAAATVTDCVPVTLLVFMSVTAIASAPAVLRVAWKRREPWSDALKV